MTANGRAMSNMTNMVSIEERAEQTGAVNPTFTCKVIAPSMYPGDLRKCKHVLGQSN